jgi:hypothetical protein
VRGHVRGRSERRRQLVADVDRGSIGHRKVTRARGTQPVAGGGRADGRGRRARAWRGLAMDECGRRWRSHACCFVCGCL